MADEPTPEVEQQLPEIRAAVVSIVWDWEHQTWDINHDGLNHYEALGMLIRACDWMRGKRYQ